MDPGAHFENPAVLYDLAHQWKDYAADGARLRAVLDTLQVPAGATVLEAACGTARYLAELAPRYQASGFDLDPQMLQVAHQRLPQARLWQADLVDFTVDEPVDALLLLFGGLAYVPPEHLAQACGSLARALRPGGVALIEPWLTAERFEADLPQLAVVDTRFLKATRICVPRREGQRALLDFHWLVGRPGAPVKRFIESNTLWLYEDDALIDALTRAGLPLLRVEGGLMRDGRLFVCRRAG